MKYEVQMWLGGQTFTEEVRANNTQDAKRTAQVRNPSARVVSINVVYG